MSTETPDLPDLRERLDRAADAPSFRAVDLDAVVGRGSRLRARRRMASGVAALAALAVIGAGLGLAVESRPEASRDLEPAGTSTGPAPTSDTPLAWARDGVVHLGEETVRPAHGVDAFLQSADGLIVLGTDGRVRRLDAGSPDETLLDPSAPPIGDRFAPRLVTDGYAWVGWVTAPRAGDVRLHVVSLLDDGSAPRTTSLAGLGTTDASPLVSISDGTAYVRLADGVVSMRLDSRRTQQVEPLPSGAGDWVVDVRGGTVVRAVGDGTTATDQDGRTRTLTSDGRPILGSRGLVSPTGSGYAPDLDHVTVVRATGKADLDLTPDVGSRYAYFSTVYRWIDDSTVAVLAAEAEQGPYALLRCDVYSRACGTEVRLDSPDGLVLPTGERIG